MTVRSFLSCSICSFVVTMVLCSVVWGQPQFSDVDSLEWMAADSKVIVRGAIVDCKREARKGNYVWEAVTVESLETLKGTHEPKIMFVVRTSVLDDDLARWTETRQQLLFFFVDSRRLAEADRKYAHHKLGLSRRGYWKRSCVELAKEAKSNLLTLDLQIPSDPKTILRRTRDAIAASARAKPSGTHDLRWPGPLVGQSTWAGCFVDLTVPVDNRLEAQARRWVKTSKAAPNGEPPYYKMHPSSDGHWVAFDENGWKTAWLREEGAKALVHFKSEANAAILKTLLDDPACHYRTIEEGEWVAIRQRVYYVRKAAYTALEKWGVEVAKPVLCEQLVRKETDPNERAAITKVKTIGGDVRYFDLQVPGHFRTVKVVDLVSESISDLSPLAALKNAEWILLNHTQVRDLSPLVRLKNLHTLDFYDTPVSDLAPLAEMDCLKDLDFCGTPVSDLAPLADLKNIEAIDLRSTRVRDLSPLANLHSLKHIELSSTPVRDLSPLAGLNNLVDVGLRDTKVECLLPLSGLTNLKRLNLEDTPVSDLKPLAKLINLETLHLQNTPVSDVSPLAGLAHLWFLDLEGTRIQDVSPLKKLKRLRSVHLRRTPLSDDEVRRFRASLRK